MTLHSCVALLAHFNFSEHTTMFEHKSAPLLSQRAFAKRMLRFAVLSAAMILGALLVGIIGYHETEQMTWLDAVLNASMILSGMGPATPLVSDSAKLFASAYALFSGIVFISCAGIVVSPIFHRIMHGLHADIKEEDS